jgi:hypothetical protein
MSTRLVAAFRGNAQCRPETGGIQWCVSGLDRDSGTVLEVLLSGAAGMQLPGELAGAELRVREESANESWEFRANGRVYPLVVRSVQVHRGAAAAFAAALPRIEAPWTTRAGWWLLLKLLRLPGMARLLRRLRVPLRE